MQMDLEEFLSLAEGYRKADKASVKNRPIGEIYEQMKYSKSPLKFAVMDDEIARLRALEEVTTARLDKDHFLKHGIERALQICEEVTGAA